MSKKILLGFEVGKGERIEIDPSHLVVTGVTQMSGKTTTLESCVKRSGRKTVVFRTKIGEKSFLEGTIIPPFFRDRSDWEFIKGLIESTMKTRIDKFEQASIIKLCKQTGGNSILDFKKKVDQRLTEKISNSTDVTLTNLQAYLEKVVPKLQTITFSNTLDLVDGLNIIDLERFSREAEVQGLIIASVLEEILYNFKNVTVIVPESWKFIPEERGSPCKLIVEEFIRQGATNGNYLWIDSQDMAGVDKRILKQITTWILGYQSEKNEVKHTLDQLPIPNAVKPKPDEIMSLGMGIFYLATRERTIKTYVLPFWLDEERGIKIARGEMKVTEVDKPQTLTPYRIATKEPMKNQPHSTELLDSFSANMRKEMNELRQDFFDKISDIQQQIVDTKIQVNEIRNSAPAIDENTVIAKVLQKIPTPLSSVSSNGIDEEKLIQKILSRVPSGGNIVYTVEPLEKLKKDFLEEAKNRILAMISGLTEEQKKSLKFSETKKPTSKKEIYNIGLGKGGGYAGGGTFDKAVNEMVQNGLMRKDTKGNFFGNIKERIKQECDPTGITEEEIQQVYNHIIMEMLK